MCFRSTCVLALAGAVLFGLRSFAAETVASPATTGNLQPTHVQNFRLLDHQDRSHELYRAEAAPAVVLYIYGMGCPIVRQSVPKFNQIQEAFAERGVRFFMISANTHDTREEIAADAEDFGITAPILLDTSQVITRSLGVKRTAEAILIDPQDKWRIVYRGAVDDRFDYGARKENAEHEWLRDALEAHLQGEAPPASKAETKGCLVHFLQPAEISYSRDIAPILQEKCVSCHTAGGIAPFAMSNYRRVRGWAPMIRETVLTRQMPPWHADPHYGDFENDRALSAAEEARLIAWIDQGASKADDEPDPLAENAGSGAAQWTLGEPDAIVQIPEVQQLSAEGSFDYRYFNVPVGISEDKWVRAVEVQPSNPAVLHHALIFVIYPERYEHIQPEVRGGLNGFFAAFLPGMPIRPYPDGSGQFLPAGSLLVFQMHYNATGKEETDQTRVGLYFHESPPARALMIQAAAETDFEIPPHAADHPMEARWRAREDVMLYGLSPHMHYRGSRFKYTAQFPEGAEQVLLNVPFYQFDWQPMYMLKEPLILPANTVIHCEGAFDNSKYNPRNPDPGARVRFGEQSWEEMFIGYIAYSKPRRAEDFAAREVQTGEALTEDNLAGSTWRMGRQFALTLNPDKSVSVRGQTMGQWRVEGNQLIVEGLGRSLRAVIHEDSLIAEGRRLRRVEPGEEDSGPRELQQRRQRPEGGGQDEARVPTGAGEGQGKRI